MLVASQAKWMTSLRPVNGNDIEGRLSLATNNSTQSVAVQ